MAIFRNPKHCIIGSLIITGITIMSCVFAKKYMLMNDEFVFNGNNNEPRYLKQADSIIATVSLENLNWGWYSIELELDNNLHHDTLIMKSANFRIIDKWGQANNKTIDGRIDSEDSLEVLIIPPQSKKKHLFVAYSLGFTSHKYWADSVWIILPELTASDGRNIMPLDTLLFIRK